MNLKTSKNLDYSFEKEKEIAKRFSTRFQWEMIIIGIGQACVWLALWPLTSLNIIPLWIAFTIATICTVYHIFHRMSLSMGTTQEKIQFEMARCICRSHNSNSLNLSV